LIENVSKAFIAYGQNDQTNKLCHYSNGVCFLTSLSLIIHHFHTVYPILGSQYLYLISINNHTPFPHSLPYPR